MGLGVKKEKESWIYRIWERIQITNEKRVAETG